MKTCGRCGEEKPLDGFDLARGRARSTCRECRNASRRARNAQRKDVIRERNQRYYWNDRARINAQKRDYWQRTNAERRATQAAWRERNVEVIAERNAAYYAANKDKWPAARKRSYEKNRDKVLAHQAFRRGLKTDRHAQTIERVVVWERDGGICGICGDRADHADWHLDHIVPLALGGAHAYYNVQVAHPTCNYAKRDRWDGQAALPVAR